MSSEMLLAFERPASMSESEMRAWINERARLRRPALTLGEIVTGPDRPMSVRIQVRAESTSAGDEQLEDLMLDMRLLGLRPSVVRAD